MGYYTFFSLSVKDKEDNTEDNGIYEKEIQEEYPNASFEEEVKWYDFDEDMKEYSKKYPNLIFSLYGDGEESEDFWLNYYHNGKVQVAVTEITYSKFDENLLS